MAKIHNKLAQPHAGKSKNLKIKQNMGKQMIGKDFF